MSLSFFRKIEETYARNDECYAENLLAQSIIKAYWLILTWATATVTGWNGTLYSQSSIQTRQTAGGGTAFPASALKRGKIF